MRIAFRVDATERIGGGHAMRCLTLADALREQGAETLFVCAALPASLRERVTGAGHALQMITPPDGLDREGDDWHEPPLAEEAQSADAAATLAALDGRADWMVVDHYLLSRTWHSAARSGASRILVIDDLANRPLDCDLLLDQTFARDPSDYSGLVSGSAKILAGASYALLRPEFARERPAALERRKAGGEVGRILISLGTTDIGGITGRVFDVVAATAPDCAIDVVLGEQAPSLRHIRAAAAADPTVEVHVGTNDMAALMRDADLAIGAAGTTSWERCCLGLPSVTLMLAGNQSVIAEQLNRVGAHRLVETTDAQGLATAIAQMIEDGDLRRDMASKAAAVTDGAGTGRVVDALLSPRPQRAVA